jgi:undecaprenyl-diphosphatase
MIGATSLTLYKSGMNFNSGEIITLVIGFVTAFLVALIVVEKFVSYLKQKPMKIFAIYRIIVGVALLLLIKSVNISV